MNELNWRPDSEFERTELCSIINSAGTGDHPLANAATLLGFRAVYVLDVLTEVLWRGHISTSAAHLRMTQKIIHALGGVK